MLGDQNFQALQDQTTYILTYNHQDESTGTFVYCDIQDLLPSLTQTIIILCSLKWSVRAFEGPYPALSTPMMPDSYPATFELSSSYLPFKGILFSLPVPIAVFYCGAYKGTTIATRPTAFSVHILARNMLVKNFHSRLDRPTTKPYAMGCAKPFDPTAVLC